MVSCGWIIASLKINVFCVPVSALENLGGVVLNADNVLELVPKRVDV